MENVSRHPKPSHRESWEPREWGSSVCWQVGHAFLKDFSKCGHRESFGQAEQHEINVSSQCCSVNISSLCVWKKQVSGFLCLRIYEWQVFPSNTGKEASLLRICSKNKPIENLGRRFLVKGEHCVRHIWKTCMLCKIARQFSHTYICINMRIHCILMYVYITYSLQNGTERWNGSSIQIVGIWAKYKKTVLCFCLPWFLIQNSVQC